MTEYLAALIGGALGIYIVTHKEPKRASAGSSTAAPLSNQDPRTAAMPVEANARRLAFKLAFFEACKRVDMRGIPVPLAYAQAALETGHGNPLNALGKPSVFARSNNLFMILAQPGWQGALPPVQSLPNALSSNPSGDSHRAYVSWEESIKDWVRLISTVTRYHDAYAAALAMRPQDFFAALQKAGYAGNNAQYAASLARTYQEVA